MRRKWMIGLFAWGAALGAVAITAAGEPHALPLRIVVHAGDHARSDAPVELALARFEAPAEGIRLVELASGGDRETPYQLVARSEKSANDNGAGDSDANSTTSLVWRLAGETPANAVRRYELRAGAPTSRPGVFVASSHQGTSVFVGKMLFFQYNAERVEPPAGVAANYGRGAFIHPLASPAGVVVTDAFPPDHLHQNGIWLAYPKARFRNQDVNFWELASGQGTVRHKMLEAASGGELFAEIAAAHEHVVLSGDAPTVALNELWRLRAWGRANSEPATPYVLDLDSTQSCATDDPLEVLQYHYGGMAVRGAREWRPESCSFLTSNGKTRADGNHAVVRWCDLTGKSSGQASDAPTERIAGIALLSHPDNLRHPEAVRIHPEMPYFCFTPAVAGDWKIEPGALRRFRYRLVVHDGPADATLLDRLWTDWAFPPQATLEKPGD